MRFSTALDSFNVLRPAPERQGVPMVAEPPARPGVLPEPTPDDLDQRVRQLGEWQLEDW